MDFSSKIDRDAAWSFGKKSPVDIRKSKLTEYFFKFGDFNDFDDFYLSWLLDDLYKQIGIHSDVKLEELSSVQWPSFSDLLTVMGISYSFLLQTGTL